METALPHTLRIFCWGVLHAIGAFDPAELAEEENVRDLAEYRTWFCLGETCTAGLLAAAIAVPGSIWFTERQVHNTPGRYYTIHRQEPRR